MGALRTLADAAVDKEKLAPGKPKFTAADAAVLQGYQHAQIYDAQAGSVHNDDYQLHEGNTG